MVKSADMPAVSAFTEEFALQLRAIVDEIGVSRQTIADLAGRSRAFVSDQLLGKRPIDTDVISAVAESCGAPARFLVRQIMDRMPPDIVGIPGVGSAVEYSPIRRTWGSGKSAAAGVSDDASIVQDLIDDEQFAAHPAPRKDVEGDVDPDLQ